MREEVDFIIVGQGLAGSSLALQLITRGKKIKVFDQPGKNHCSVVAAGLFNPITGKGLKKTWLADVIFPELHSFYLMAEGVLGENFFYPSLLYRPFGSVEEQNEWMGKSSQDTMKGYIGSINTEPRMKRQVKDPLGGIVLNQCGYLNTLSYLNGVREYLNSQSSFVDQYVDPSELSFANDVVELGHLSAKKIIFCTGLGLQKSTFSHPIPIIPLKGETLTIEMEERPEMIFSRGLYIVPAQGNLFKAGATYSLEDQTEGITEAGRMELEWKLKGLIEIPSIVVGQEWGMRPTTHDRKPIMGSHPINQNVIIFNGLGTKGVSLAPYFSARLVDWLMNKGEIITEINIRRYKSLYS